MMRYTPTLAAALGAAVLIAGAAEAALVSIDSEFGTDTVTLDTDTGLEWLDWSLTTNRSFDDISSELGAGGEFEGFRYATADEVATLWTNGGIVDITTVPPVDFTTDFTRANFAPAGQLVTLLGLTGQVPGPGNNALSEGLTSTQDAEGAQVVAELQLCGNSGLCVNAGADRFTALASLGPNTQNASESRQVVGSALVRVEVIPVPGAAWLALSALLSLGAFRKRRS
jgi:hypothetical protein